jgi:hypothetical protein
MFLITAAFALGTVGAVLLTYRRLFSPDHRFLSNKLLERSPGDRSKNDVPGKSIFGAWQARLRGKIRH